MKKNMGTIDRIVRVILASLIVFLYLTHQITGVTAIILLAVAAIFVLTAYLAACPLYSLLGIRTRYQKV